MSKDGDNTEPSIDDIVASIRRIISDEETRTRKPPAPAAKTEDILELTDMLNEDGSVTSLPAAAAPAPAATPMTPFGDDEAPIYADKPSAEGPRIINRPPASPADDRTLRATPPAGPKPAEPPSVLRAAEAPSPVRPADPGTAPQPASPPSPPNSARVTPAMSNNTTNSSVTLTPVNPPAPGGIVSPQAAGAATAAFDRLTQAALQQNAPPPPPKPAPGPLSGKSVEDLVRDMLRPMLQQWMDANLPGMVERLVQQEIQRLTKR